MLMYVDQLNLTHWEWIGIFFYWLMTIVWRLGYIFSNKNPRYFLHSRRSKLLLVTIWSRPCGPTDEANSHRRYSRHYVTRSDEASSHQRYSRLHVTRMIFTDPYSLQQNDIVKRKNWSIMNMVRSLLKSKNMPKELWSEAIDCGVYLSNCCPTRSIINKNAYWWRCCHKLSEGSFEEIQNGKFANQWVLWSRRIYQGTLVEILSI